jgi:hypothetical protein
MAKIITLRSIVLSFRSIGPFRIARIGFLGSHGARAPLRKNFRNRILSYSCNALAHSNRSRKAFTRPHGRWNRQLFADLLGTAGYIVRKPNTEQHPCCSRLRDWQADLRRSWGQIASSVLRREQSDIGNQELPLGTETKPSAAALVRPVSRPIPAVLPTVAIRPLAKSSRPPFGCPRGNWYGANLCGLGPPDGEDFPSRARPMSVKSTSIATDWMKIADTCNSEMSQRCSIQSLTTIGFATDCSH